MKKKPLRRCTGCNNMIEKKDLIRVVKNKENQIFIDKSFKMQGRGAYICNKLECFEKSYKNKGLERSFKGRVDKEIYDKLREEFDYEQ